MREITLNHITKIEGHAKLALNIEKGKVRKCELSATEGSRYFEGIVRGRKYFEAHEITSRICGICSCAHTVAALMAIEDALCVEPSEQTKKLRTLLTLGERIRSHATHLYFLALPDYLGYESALAMASDHKKELERALRLMKAGNAVVACLGGRDLHPVSLCVGGWLRLPEKNKIKELRDLLKPAKRDAAETAKLFFSLAAPEFESQSTWLSLSNETSYAVLEGTPHSPKQDFERHSYLDFLKEKSKEYSTANFVTLNNEPYFVGALARLNNNSRRLSSDAKRLLKRSGLELPSRNPFMNNIAQAIELAHCIDHALQIIEGLELRQEEAPETAPRAGRGVASIEVPRGTLWHDYTLNESGTITSANIITPTAQNLLSMQEDIRQFVPSLTKKPKGEIVMGIEKLIRSYDPCFSCSAHFLEVEWE